MRRGPATCSATSCARTGLLDPTGLLDGLRIGILNQVVELLNRILGAL